MSAQDTILILPEIDTIALPLDTDAVLVRPDVDAIAAPPPG
jgi:hypothetical protein